VFEQVSRMYEGMKTKSRRQIKRELKEEEKVQLEAGTGT